MTKIPLLKPGLSVAEQREGLQLLLAYLFVCHVGATDLGRTEEPVMQQAYSIGADALYQLSQLPKE